MQIDTNKTIEQLENIKWGKPNDDDSYLIKTCFELRQKPIVDFSIEDLRIMIGQEIGIDYLIPKALNKLKENILAEGDFYEGDLLKSVLEINKNYWLRNNDNYLIFIQLFIENETILKESDISDEIKKNWFELFESLK